MKLVETTSKPPVLPDQRTAADQPQSPVAIAIGWVLVLVALTCLCEALAQLAWGMGDHGDAFTGWVFAALCIGKAMSILGQRRTCGRRVWPWIAVSLAAMAAVVVLSAIGLGQLHQLLGQASSVHFPRFKSAGS